jgi:hypothetical protein
MSSFHAHPLLGLDVILKKQASSDVQEIIRVIFLFYSIPLATGSLPLGVDMDYKPPGNFLCTAVRLQRSRKVAGCTKPALPADCLCLSPLRFFPVDRLKPVL